MLKCLSGFRLSLLISCLHVSIYVSRAACFPACGVQELGGLGSGGRSLSASESVGWFERVCPKWASRRRRLKYRSH